MPAWLTICLALGGSAVINTAVGFIITRALKSAFRKRDQQQIKEDQDKIDLEKYRFEQERTERLAEIKTLLQPVSDDVQEIKSMIANIADGTLSTLRNDITACYYRCKEKGYRNDYDFQNIHDMYQSYEALHGNSYISDIMERFDDLPVKEDTIATKVVERRVKSEVK